MKREEWQEERDRWYKRAVVRVYARRTECTNDDRKFVHIGRDVPVSAQTQRVG